MKLKVHLLTVFTRRLVFRSIPWLFQVDSECLFILDLGRTQDKMQSTPKLSIFIATPKLSQRLQVENFRLLFAQHFLDLNLNVDFKVL